METGIYECKLCECEQIALNTYTATFKVLHPPLEFKPGQYLRITNPDLLEDCKKGRVRDFSISSAPEEPFDSFSISFRGSESAFKQALIHNSNPDTTFYVEGPYGVFCLPENIHQPVALLAFGIGITPFISMLLHSTKHKSDRLIHIIYVDSKEDPIFNKELEKLAQDFANIVVTKHFTKSFSIKTLENYAAFDRDVIWYISGPTNTVRLFNGQITKILKVNPSKIRTEEFVGYDPLNPDYMIPHEDKEPLRPIELSDYRCDVRFFYTFIPLFSNFCLISITDKYGRIIYTNDKFMEVSKYSKEELIGQNHRILKSGHHDSSFFKELWKTISSGNYWRGNIKNRAKDGSLYWVETSICPIFYEDKKEIEYYASVRVLITDKKLLEESRLNTIRTLEKLNQRQNQLDSILQRYDFGEQLLKIGTFTLDISKDQPSMQIDANLQFLLNKTVK